MAATKELIKRIRLTSSAASISFYNIPQDFDDLILVVSARTSNSGGTGLYLTINGSTSSFSGRYLQGNGSSAYGGTITRWVGTTDDASQTASVFSNHEIYFPNYSSTTLQKSFSSTSVTENNATGSYQDLGVGLWAVTSAITSLTLGPDLGTMPSASSFALYGIKGGSDGTTTVS